METLTRPVEQRRGTRPRRADPPARSTRRLALVLGAVLLVPLVVAAVRLVLGADFPASGDTAITELAIHDVGRHAVLLGPYSRFHFHHPGPALFYLLTPAYQLLGERSAGPFLGAILVNAGAIVGIVWTLHRRAPRVLVAGALLLALWIRFLGIELVRSDWNPLVTVLPFALFVLVAWAITEGSAPSLVGAVAIGSFLVQSHVAYAPVVGVVLATTIVWWGVGVARARGGDLRRSAVWLLTAAGVGIVMWAPPAWQELRDEPGNLGELERFFRESRPTLGLGDGIHVVLRQLGALPRALAPLGGVQIGYSDVTALGLLTGIVFVAATLAALRVRAGGALRLAALVTIVAGVGVISISRIDGAFEPYLATWLSAASFLAWMSVGVSIAAVLGRRGAPRLGAHGLRVARGVAIAAVVLVSGLTTFAATGSGAPDPQGAGIRRLVTAAVAAVPRHRGAVLVKNEQALWPEAASMVLALEKKGLDPKVPADLAWLYEARLTDDGARVGLELDVVSPAAASVASPDTRVVARSGGVAVTLRPVTG